MASLQPNFGFKVYRAKENIVHREVSRANRPVKSLVVRQKVSLRIVARELIARLQMAPRRFVNEQKCPKEKRHKKACP
jgi:hypothetical protein